MEREKLIQARAGKCWTLEEAAEQIGVDCNTVYRWEHSLSTPSGRNLRQLCEVYGVSALELGFNNGYVTASHDSVPPARITLPASEEKAHVFLETDLTMRLLALAFTPQHNLLELQDTMARIIEDHDMKTNDDDAQISRREALRRLALLPLLTLKLSALQSVLHRPVEEVLMQCAASISACWELSKSNDGADLSVAFKSVSAYVPALKAIVKDSSRYQKEAANLVGQCSLLKTVLGWHLEGLRNAAIYAQDAVTYAKEAGDSVLLLCAFRKVAWLHYYNNCSKQAYNTMNQSLSVLKEAKEPLPPCLVGGTYSSLAVMQARNGQRATVPLRQAAEAFFSGQEEQHFVYMDFTQGNLILNDSMAHYQQGEYDKVLDSLGQIFDPETLKLRIALPERTSIEGLNIMTMALLKGSEKDMERTLHCWQAAIQGAHTLQSEQRLSEALVSYEVMQSVWPGEKRITGLRDLAVHW